MGEKTKNSVVDFENIKRQFDFYQHTPSVLHLKAALIMSRVHRGLHNCPAFRSRKNFNTAFGCARFVEYHCGIGLSTQDTKDLTVIVLMAHALCVRVEVSPAMRYLRLGFSERDKSKPQSIMDGHPTIEMLKESADYYAELETLDVEAEWEALAKEPRP